MAGTPETGAPLPTLALPQCVAIDGWFPSADGPSTSMFSLGMIHSYAGRPDSWVAAPFGMPLAQGQTYAPLDHPQLFSVMGAAFGGDGYRSFALPSLTGRAATETMAIDTDFPGKAQTLPLRWLIAAEGATPRSVPGFATYGVLQTGMLALFCGGFVPSGWLPCDGSSIAPDDQPALHAVIGQSFGWLPDGSIALPNLNEQVVIGPPPGAVPGQTRPYWPGDQFQSVPGGFCMQWLICTQGVYPSAPAPGQGSTFSPTAGFLGQVIAYAGKDIPAGWAACDGSMLQIADNQELFVLLENAYGGDGELTFGLPDLRGTMIVGT